MNIPIDSIHQIERYDPLTGCGNLVSFIEALRTQLGDQRCTSFSLLLLDLNSFMQLNLNKGHATGNAMLIKGCGGGIPFFIFEFDGVFTDTKTGMVFL